MATFMGLSTTLPSSPLCPLPIAGLLVSLFVVLSPSAVNSGPVTASANDCAAPIAPGETVTTTLRTGPDTVRLSFPQSYLVPLGFTNEAERDAITFAVDATSFLPIGDGVSRSALEAAANEDTILIMPKVIREDLRPSAIDEFARLQVMTHHYGERMALKPTDFPELIAPDREASLSTELFFREENGRTKDVITCHKQIVGINPRCGLVTQYNGLLLHIGFARSILSDWETLRTNSVSIIQCFRENQSK